MKIEKVLTLLIAVVLAAAVVVFVVKLSGSRGGPSEPVPVSVEAGSGNAELLVIGIQGLEPRLVDRLSKAGRIPNITSLMSRGAVGTYPNFGRDTDAAITWTSLVTGMLPENQGVGGTMISRRGEVVDAPLTPKHRTVGAMWTYLGAAGKKSGVVCWPGTWPVETIEGVMVGPHSTYTLERAHGGDPSQGISPPSEIERFDPLMMDRDELERADLSRFVDLDSRIGLEALMGQNHAALASAYSADRSAVDAARAMAVDLGIRDIFVNLPGIDLASQRFWHYMETEAIEKLEVGEDEKRLLRDEVEALGGAIDAYYEFTDGLVGELLDLAGSGATIAVVTDHGYAGIQLDASDRPKVGTDMHSEEGMWILAGPHVKPGASLDCRLIDVAPTIMAAAGITPTIDLDGAVLENALNR
jgi:predicted AlkP superfamily phosphohydrolase/phosphomutase